MSKKSTEKEKARRAEKLRAFDDLQQKAAATPDVEERLSVLENLRVAIKVEQEDARSLMEKKGRLIGRISSYTLMGGTIAATAFFGVGFLAAATAYLTADWGMGKIAKRKKAADVARGKDYFAALAKRERLVIKSIKEEISANFVEVSAILAKGKLSMPGFKERFRSIAVRRAYESSGATTPSPRAGGKPGDIFLTPKDPGAASPQAPQ